MPTADERVEYTSLVDAPRARIYDAIADVEHHPEFVAGVDSLALLAVTDATKTDAEAVVAALGEAASGRRSTREMARRDASPRRSSC